MPKKTPTPHPKRRLLSQWTAFEKWVKVGGVVRPDLLDDDPDYMTDDALLVWVTFCAGVNWQQWVCK